MTPQNQLIDREPTAPDSALRTPHSTLRSSSRSGFTLVELLIVMTVIGILVGMLMVGISGVMSSARELSIRTDMVQMEQSIESFKTKHGFYPPSFEQFNRGVGATDLTEGASQFRRFLNRIAPNHNEGSNFPGGSVSRINVWWNKIGRHLNQATALNFWLSGLCKSKQYPLTGGAPQLIEAFNGPVRFDVGSNEIERDVFYEFKNGQLAFGTIDSDVIGNGSIDAVVTNIDATLYELDQVPVGRIAVTAAMQQAYGAANGDKVFRYRDAASYGFAPYAYMEQLPPAVGTAFDLATNTNVPVFVNPKTYQLISFGMDGEPGVPFTLAELTNEKRFQLQASVYPVNSDVLAEVVGEKPDYKGSLANRAADNMTNFAEGRMELFWINN